MEQTRSTQRRFPSTVAFLVAFLGAAGSLSAFAQQRQPGELWRQTVSVEADGMSMPARTMEICLPTIAPQAELRRPPQEGMSCRFYDLRDSGGRSSGKMDCKGDEGAMTGSFETLTEGNRVRSTVSLTGPEGRMTFRRDATRIGTSCTTMEEQAETMQKEAAANAQRMQAQACSDAVDRLRANPADIASSYVFFGGCEPSQRAEFCAALASPVGYMALHDHDARLREASAREGRAQAAHPLRDSASACGYGSGDSASIRLRAKATDEARKLFARGVTPLQAADLLVLDGTDTDFATLRTTALGKCQGMLYTSAGRNSGDFCSAYGMVLARNDRAAARAIALGRDPGSPVSASSPGVLSPGTFGTAPVTAPVQDPPRTPAAAPAPAPAPAKPGLGDLLRRGRGVLDGVLGR